MLKSRLPFHFILITLVLNAMGIGIIMPVMPDLIRDVTGTDLAHAAIWGGVLATSFAVMQFLFSPLIGNLSDRFGRRPVLLASLLVVTLDYLLMATANTIWLLLAARIIGGIATATQSTASAFMADVSAPGEKAKNFALTSAAFGLGFVLGPVLGGVLGSFGPRAPFLAAATLTAANFAFGWLVMRESLPAGLRRPFEWRRANPLGALRHIARLPGLAPLLLVVFLNQIAFFVYPSIWAYFTRARYGWSPAMVGYSLALFGLSMVLVQGWLIRPILARLGERGAVFLGFSIEILSFLLIALIPNGLIVLALTPLSALGGIAGPALQAILSHRVAANQQGELQGLLSSIGSLGMILSPLIMTQTFAFFSSPAAPLHLPGAPFLLSALMIGTCILILRRALRTLPVPEGT